MSPPSSALCSLWSVHRRLLLLLQSPLQVPTLLWPPRLPVKRTWVRTQTLGQFPLRCPNSRLSPLTPLNLPHNHHWPPRQTATPPLLPQLALIQTPPPLLPLLQVYFPLLPHLHHNLNSPPLWMFVWSTSPTPLSRVSVETQQCTMAQIEDTCLDWRAWSISWRACGTATCRSTPHITIWAHTCAQPCTFTHTHSDKNPTQIWLWAWLGHAAETSRL